MFSLRLEREELAALELQAAQIRIKPTVLARNLIRIGLCSVTAARDPAAGAPRD